MPKKRRQKSRDNRLVEAKNMVRGATDTPTAVVRAAQIVPKSQLSEFLRWAERVKFGKRVPLPTPFPTTIRFLLSTPTPEPSDFAQELNLLCHRILFHTSEVCAFTSARLAFQRAVLNGNYAESTSILDNLQETIGHSVWLIELRIAVVSLAEGLEFQKKLTEEIKAQVPRGVTKTLTHYASQRNEPSTSPTRFIARMTDLIDRSQISTSTKVYYKFHLVREKELDMEQVQGLLLHESTASIIDIYDTLCTLAIRTATRQRDNSSEAVLSAIRDLNPIDDERLAKLRFILGLNDDSKLKTRDLKQDESLLKGNDFSEEHCRQSPHDDPRSIWIEALHRSLTDKEIPAAETARDKLAAALTSIFTFEDTEEAATQVVKWNLNFGGLSTIEAVLEYVNDLTSSDAPLSRETCYRALLHSPYLDPWDLPFIPESTRDRYLSALSSRYGNALPVAYASWLCNCGNAGSTSLISDDFRIVGETYRAYSEGAFAKSAQLSLELEPIKPLRRFALRWHSHSLLAQGLEKEAICYVASRVIESEDYYDLLPIAALFAGRKWKDLKRYTDLIELAVLLDLYWRRNGNTEVNSFRRYAAEDFLSSLGIEAPSELRAYKHQLPLPTLIYFLANVCAPDVLDLMVAFPSSRSVQEERRNIYILLTEFDPQNAEFYREQVTQITRLLMVDEGVRLLDQSRVFVDEEGVVRWAERELKEGFERYKGLFQAGVGFDVTEFLTALKNFLIHQEPLPSQFMALPKGEADELLLDIIYKLKENFLLSPAHGLDAYLSLRVRHGTLSGMLRGPLEENHIVNQRISGTKRYQRNPYWAENLTQLSSNQLSDLGHALMSFSEEYDAGIDDLRGRLQIRRKERPNGIFDITLTTFHVYLLKAELSSNVELEDFVRRCSSLYWSLLEPSLVSVQRYISNDFRDSIAALFEKLESNVQRSTAGTRVTQLNDAIHQGFTAVQTVLDNIKNWFQRGPASKFSYPISQAVDVAIEVVRTTYRNFSPKVEKRILVDTAILTTSVTIISDIIFTALDNVYQHSGLRDPEVLISVEKHGDNAIRFVVENELSKEFDYTGAETKVAESQARISRHEYKTDAVSREGGTGLLKLKSFVDPTDNRSDALTFGLSENGRFRVTVIVEAYV